VKAYIEALGRFGPVPNLRVNRSFTVGRARRGGLALLDERGDSKLSGYPNVYLVRGALNEEFGRPDEANAAHLNPAGTVHGGLSATLLDSCIGLAIVSTLDKGFGQTTLEFKISLLRTITPETGLIRAEGHVISRGRRVGTAEGRLTDSKGNILAHGTTCPFWKGIRREFLALLRVIRLWASHGQMAWNPDWDAAGRGSPTSRAGARTDLLGHLSRALEELAEFPADGAA